MTMSLMMMKMVVMVMRRMMMLVMVIQVRLPWQMGIFSPRLSKRRLMPEEDDNEDLEMKSSTYKYLGGKSSPLEYLAAKSSPPRAGGDEEGLQTLGGRDPEVKI